MYFMALTFIVIIILVIFVHDATQAVLIVSLLANTLFIYMNLDKLRTVTNDDKSSADVAVDPPAVESMAADQQDPALYGDDFERWHSYDASYTGAAYATPTPHSIYSGSENTLGVDGGCALMAQRRGLRDKQALDGATLKDANYYKFHFADEFKREEAKPWWGNYEV